MRGFRLFGGSTIAALLLCASFLSLHQAQAAVRTRPEAQVQPEAQRDGIGAAVQWLVLEHQNDDGGYASFSAGAGQAPSDVGGTADAILALASTGHNVAAPYPGREQSPVDFLRENADDAAAYAAQSVGANGKLILALAAAAQDPREFGGYDFTISLTEHLSPTGQYNVISPYEQGLAILAQSVVSDTVPEEAISWLRSVQAQDGEISGSWDDGFGTTGNVDATAMAIMALLAAGEDREGQTITSARTFLLENQVEGGGWAYAPGLPESANSTALAIQALSALGEDYYSPDSDWAVDGRSPLMALADWQSESGAFQADFGEGPADDFFTTVQALPALTGRAYPLPAKHEAVRRAVACLATMQDTDSGGWAEFAGMESSAGGTARAIRALSASGAALDDERFVTEGGGPLDALEVQAPLYLEGARGGRLGAVMRGVIAAGADPDDFAGFNLPVRTTDVLSPTGEYDSTAFGPFSHAQAMLGLHAAGATVDPSAEAWLVSAQGDDGGWGGPDATGISLQVLARLNGEAHVDVIAGALENLQTTQQADGGWGFDLPSSVNSTSEVAQGLIAAGENPFDLRWSVVTSGTVYNAADVALAQQGENGCWPNLFGEGDDPYATTDGIILLSLTPNWGAVVEPQQEIEETPTTESEEAQAPTPTTEPVEEATEAAPSPTETVVAEPTSTPAATAEPEAQDSAAPTEAAPDGADPEGFGTVFLWIALALVLLVGVMIYFRVTSRR